MSRGTFVIFGLVVLLFAILVPAWAISEVGEEEASPQNVSADLQEGKELFVTNCGSCHTLYKAGTDGVVGPDLDDVLAPPSPTDPDPSTIEPRVLDAIENGREGQMPAGILTGSQAKTVANFVARCAGEREACRPASSGNGATTTTP